MKVDAVYLAPNIVSIILPKLPYARLEVHQCEITCAPPNGAKVQLVLVTTINELSVCQHHGGCMERRLLTVSTVLCTRFENVSPVRRCQADMKLFQHVYAEFWVMRALGWSSDAAWRIRPFRPSQYHLRNLFRVAMSRGDRSPSCSDANLPCKSARRDRNHEHCSQVPFS